MDVVKCIIKGILKANGVITEDRTNLPATVEHFALYQRPDRPARVVSLTDGKVYPIYNITLDTNGKPRLGMLPVGAMLDAASQTLEEACQNYQDVFHATLTLIDLEDYRDPT